MVRLKQIIEYVEKICEIIFQFHNGSIKTDYKDFCEAHDE